MRAVLWGSLLHIVRLAVGFLRGKYLAMVLGPSGVGLLSQVAQLLPFFCTFSTLSLSPGLIHHLAPAEGERKFRYLKSGFSLITLLSLGVFVLGCFFLEPITSFVFGPHGSREMTLAVLIAMPFQSLALTYVQSVFYGFSRYDLFVRSSIVALILSFIVFVTMVYREGFMGAVWAVPVGAALFLGVFAVGAAKLVPWSALFRWGLHYQELRSMMRFSFVILTISALEYGTNLLVRREILLSLGAEQNGILQVPIALTAYLTPFVTNGLWGRLFTTASRHRDSLESKAEFQSSSKWTLLIAIGFVLILLPCRDLFIHMAYTDQFLEASPLIRLQLVGDYFYLLAFPVLIYFLGIGRLKLYFLGWGFYYAVFLSAAYVLIPRLGLVAVPVSYLAASLGTAFCCYLWVNYWCGMPHRRSMSMNAVVGTLLVGLQFLLCESAALRIQNFILPVIFWGWLAYRLFLRSRV